MILTKEQQEWLTNNKFGAGHTDLEIADALAAAGLIQVVEVFTKSSGQDGTEAGDWTQTEGAGLTDDTTTNKATLFVKPTIHNPDAGTEGAS